MSSLTEAITEARRMSHGNGTATVETAKWLRILTALLRAERIEAAARDLDGHTYNCEADGSAARGACRCGYANLAAALAEEP